MIKKILISLFKLISISCLFSFIQYTLHIPNIIVWVMLLLVGILCSDFFIDDELRDKIFNKERYD